MGSRHGDIIKRHIAGRGSPQGPLRFTHHFGDHKKVIVPALARNHERGHVIECVNRLVTDEILHHFLVLRVAARGKERLIIGGPAWWMR